MLDLLDQAQGAGRRLRRLSRAGADHVLPALVHDGSGRGRLLVRARDAERRDAAAVRAGRQATGIGFELRLRRADPRRAPLQHRRSWSTATGAIVGKYRKVHLPGHAEFDPSARFQHLEKRYFEPGDLGFPVWRIMGGIFGMCICNDRRWPETYRVMGLQGVEMVVLGYNTPSVNSQKAEEGPEKRMFHHKLSVQAGAYQNSTWVVAVAKAGVEDGHPLFGGSVHRQSGRRDRRRGEDRGRRADRARLRSRRHPLRQGDDLRFRAPPPHRALRAHHVARPA